ncbi:MAG: DUF2059 domain-containing protein [Candidatus Omnitrophica bacterium]|nr:DUF2059 domain-containing protein [Candidatus Omnitrophota bacterium]
MKKIILVLAVFFLMSSLCSAETVYLKSGKAIKGKVVERAEGQVTIDANGMMLTYDEAEIDHIEGAPASSTSQEPLTNLPLLEQPSSPKATDTLEESPGEKRDLILRYIEITGAKANMQKTFDDIVKAAAPEKKAKLRQALNIDNLLDQFVPIYDQYLTTQDLKDLIAFYESPAARKLSNAEPLLFKDIMEKSRQYLEGKIE